jgi:ribulose kinase
LGILLNCRQLFVQTHADVLGLSLILPNETESVLLGAAMLGAAAAEKLKHGDSYEEVLVSHIKASFIYNKNGVSWFLDLPEIP